VEATALQISDRTETPLEELEARELGGAIEVAIGQLRPEYRACILLRHVEGRPYEEIAEMLSLPLGTVKTYIHRARNELRQALSGLRE
jgi:RNA polymerase sigma-70 factor (ECF subfamily)